MEGIITYSTFKLRDLRDYLADNRHVGGILSWLV